MKKIFAIALALVMVLSMASAFASYCTGSFDWTCATETNYCGQGTVEVVPYVKVNNTCGGFKWEVSECASAVNSEDVFYAVKLTVDANADDEWWNTVKITTSYKGMDLPDGTSLTLFNMKNSWKAVEKLITAEDTEAVANTFYYDFVSKSWDIVNDKFELANSNVDNVPVKDASKAKVCVTLKAEDAGKNGIVGNYWVEYEENVSYEFADSAVVAKLLEKGLYDVYKAGKPNPNDYMTWTQTKGNHVNEAKYNAAVEAYEEAVKLVSSLTVTTDVVDVLSVYTKDPAKGGELLVTYTMEDDKVAAIDYTKVCGAATYETVKAFFGLEIGTCVDAKLVKANFGWKNKVEDCFAWGDKAPYVVDAECVVAIPKTGDASVLAWLF